MNWQSFFKTGAIVQLDASQYWVAQGLFCLEDDAKRPGVASSAHIIINQFYGDQHPQRLFAKESRIVSEAELVAALDAYFVQMGSDQPQKLLWREADREDFRDRFDSIKSKIREGKIAKAVPVTYEWTDQKPNLGSMLYSVLNSQRSDESVYGYWTNEAGLFGLTPERLFVKKGNELETMALAGTKLVNDPVKSDLLGDSKELSEHNFVRRFLEDKLGKLGDVEIDEPKVVRFRQLEHLKSNIKVKLKNDLKVEAIVEQLHPTPALGTFPKPKSLSELKSFDNKAKLRKEFGAPFALQLENGDFYCLVAIRNVRWDAEKTYLFSGCGIVEASEFESEWSELQSKRNSVKSILGFSHV